MNAIPCNIGEVYGFLTVDAHVRHPLTDIPVMKCSCKCGKESLVPSYALRQGKNTSCGCMKRVRIKRLNRTHGESGGKVMEYHSWQMMKVRCTNSKSDNFKYYGGRGINVCERWRSSYDNFIADMGRRPAPDFSIDRIDPNGNYEPQNCRWASKSEQSKNRRNNNVQ